MAGERILIVDDEPRICRALRAGLIGRGYVVEIASTGSEALDMVASHAPDLIILDLMLPDMSGLDVCREIRSWGTVPIIVLSAKGAERDKVDALDLGANDYLTKPFGMEELLARVRVALRLTGGLLLPQLLRSAISCWISRVIALHGLARKYVSRRRSTSCSAISWRTLARSSPTTHCCRRCGGRPGRRHRPPCEFSWPSSGARSSLIALVRCTSAPNRASAIDSSSRTSPNNIQTRSPKIL